MSLLGGWEENRETEGLVPVKNPTQSDERQATRSLLRGAVIGISVLAGLLLVVVCIVVFVATREQRLSQVVGSIVALLVVPALLLGTGAAVVACFGAVAIIRKRRLATLARRFPEARFWPMIPTLEFFEMIRGAGYVGPRPYNYSVVGINGVEVQFWHPSRKPFVRFAIPTSDVIAVTTGNGVYGTEFDLRGYNRPVNVVGLVVRDGSRTGEAWLPMMPFAPSLKFWRFPSQATVDEIADEIKTNIDRSTSNATPEIENVGWAAESYSPQPGVALFSTPTPRGRDTARWLLNMSGRILALGSFGLITIWTAWTSFALLTHSPEPSEIGTFYFTGCEFMSSRDRECTPKGQWSSDDQERYEYTVFYQGEFDRRETSAPAYVYPSGILTVMQDHTIAYPLGSKNWFGGIMIAVLSAFAGLCTLYAFVVWRGKWGLHSG